MTPYELADLAQSNFANSTSAFAIYLSVVFAYIATAYLVGAQLTATQNRMLTGLFVVVSIFNSWGVAAYASGAVRLSRRAFPDTTGRFFAPSEWTPAFMLIMGILVTVVALKFMWDVRHPKVEKT